MNDQNRGAVTMPWESIEIRCLQDGNWEYPGDPSACKFATLESATAALENLLETCPEYAGVTYVVRVRGGLRNGSGRAISPVVETLVES